MSPRVASEKLDYKTDGCVGKHIGPQYRTVESLPSAKDKEKDENHDVAGGVIELGRM
jgi:hypothetical protein